MSDTDNIIFRKDIEEGPNAGMGFVVYNMLFNDRVCLGPKDGDFYDRGFCFPKGGYATVACLTWDGTGDPPGPWIKEVGTTRYREPSPYQDA